MLRTIVLLIITLLAIPYVAFHYDQPLAPEHWAVLSTLFKIMFGVAITCFVVSELTSNYSQVDKIWSIIPIVYVWVVAVESGFSQRLVLMAVMVTIWAVRLTFNFGRRGGYHWIPWKGEEDYRWSVLRQYPFLKSRVNWSLFNLLFISLYQNSLILLFTLPTVAAWQGGDTPLNILDYLAAALFLGFVTTETIADQQQWNFQTEKYRRKNTGEALGPLYEKGFCAEGL